MRHNADAAAQLVLADVAHVHAVHQHPAARHVIKAGDEVDQRALAAARAADHADGRTGRGGEAHAGDGFRARAGIAHGNAVEDDAAARRVDGRGLFAVLLRGADGEDGGYAVAAGRSLRQRDDQVRHLNQLDENLAHVIIQRDDLPLRQRAHLHAHRAGVNQHDHRRVDDHVGRRVHHRGDAADGKLHAGEKLKLALKLRALRVLLAEGANHANARQIFAGRRGYAVQLPLHAAIHRDGRQHDGKHDDAQHGDHARENQRAFRVDGERHDHRAEDDEGRTQQQAQAHVHAGLHLIDVAVHAGDERGGADSIQLGVAQRLDMRHEHVAQLGGKADGRLGGEILRGDGTEQPHAAEHDQPQAHAHDEARIARGDAPVDDRRHNQRDDQLKGGFQQLEQRREHTFQPEIPNINKQFFQKTSTFSAIKMEQQKQIHYRLNYAIWQEKTSGACAHGRALLQKKQRFLRREFEVVRPLIKKKPR